MGAFGGLVLAAALLAPGLARAEDLTEPGAFGRFADSSRTRPDAAAVPLGVAFAPSRPTRAASLTPPSSSSSRFPSLSPVPPPAVRASKGAKTRRSGPSPAGIALVAAGGLLLLALRPERAQSIAPLAETWTPPPTWKREWPNTKAPAPLPPLRVADPLAPPRGLPWWGITDAERDAIARWDASSEKEFHKVPLDRWLDAHQAELKDVNVWRLKEKLWRDV